MLVGVSRLVHQVELRSSAFAPDPTERETGVGGMALAFWLAEVLAAAGLDVGEPFPEDYGWMLDVRGPGRVVVTCGAIDADGTAWSVVIEDVPRRLRKADPDAAGLVARAMDAVAAALTAHPGVASATWEVGGPSGT